MSNAPLVGFHSLQKKALHSEHHSVVMKALQEQGVDAAYFKVLHVYSNSPPSDSMRRGVKQGDSIPPKLFTADLKIVIENRIAKKGFRIVLELYFAAAL